MVKTNLDWQCIRIKASIYSNAQKTKMCRHVAEYLNLYLSVHSAKDPNTIIFWHINFPHTQSMPAPVGSPPKPERGKSAPASGECAFGQRKNKNQTRAKYATNWTPTKPNKNKEKQNPNKIPIHMNRNYQTQNGYLFNNCIILLNWTAPSSREY